MEPDEFIQGLSFYCLILSERRSGLSLLELIIALVIIGILVASFLGFIYRASVIARQEVLQVELKSLRTALLLYKTIEGRYPDNLAVFIKARYKIYDREGIFGKEFLGALLLMGEVILRISLAVGLIITSRQARFIHQLQAMKGGDSE